MVIFMLRGVLRGMGVFCERELSYLRRLDHGKKDSGTSWG